MWKSKPSRFEIQTPLNLNRTRRLGGTNSIWNDFAQMKLGFRPFLGFLQIIPSQTRCLIQLSHNWPFWFGVCLSLSNHLMMPCHTASLDLLHEALDTGLLDFQTQAFWENSDIFRFAFSFITFYWRSTKEPLLPKSGFWTWLGWSAWLCGGISPFGCSFWSCCHVHRRPRRSLKADWTKGWPEAKETGESNRCSCFWAQSKGESALDNL